VSVRGSFELERTVYRLGEPVRVELELMNEGDQPVYVFPPHGRANGLRLTVRGTGRYALRGLTEEPDAGLVGERELPPRGRLRQDYDLTRWVAFEEPGHYVVGFSLDLEVFDRSIRDGGERSARRLEVADDLELEVRA
jgi:hypothetical protein